MSSLIVPNAFDKSRNTANVISLVVLSFPSAMSLSKYNIGRILDMFLECLHTGHGN